MNKNYKCPTCPCKSQEEPDEWLAGTHCDCPCHLPKKHICDGGDDYGVVDCLQCEKEMIEHLKKSKNGRKLFLMSMQKIKSNNGKKLLNI